MTTSKFFHIYHLWAYYLLISRGTGIKIATGKWDIGLLEYSPVPGRGVRMISSYKIQYRCGSGQQALFYTLHLTVLSSFFLLTLYGTKMIHRNLQHVHIWI